MKIISLVLLISLMQSGCSRERIKVFDKIENNKDNYTLLFLNIDSDSSNLHSQQYHYPFYIDDQSIIQTVGKEWNFRVKDIPDHKNISYKIILYNCSDIVQETWLDSKYETAVWEDELLFFDISLLDKHAAKFKKAHKEEMMFIDAEQARLFYNSLLEMKSLFYIKTGGDDNWLKFNGKYNLKRLSGNLEPERNAGKVREKIKKDFNSKNFELIDYTFSSSEDTLNVQISADSSYVRHIPKDYFYIGNFEKYTSILIDLYVVNTDSLNGIINLEKQTDIK